MTELGGNGTKGTTWPVGILLSAETKILTAAPVDAPSVPKPGGWCQPGRAERRKANPGHWCGPERRKSSE